jgi:hypothetical protein
MDDYLRDMLNELADPKMIEQKEVRARNEG